MFGSFRFMLAFFVVLTHLISISKLGHFAVFGFFVLSGYLISLAVNQNYGFGFKSFKNFWINRVLRLYPAYFVALILTSLILLGVGEEFSTGYNDYFAFPTAGAGWLQNVTMIYPSWNPHEISPRMVPPSWALMVELFYYLLISLGVFRSARITNIILAGAISFHLYGAFYLSYDSIYFGILPALLPFCIGAQIYNYRERFVGLYQYLSDNFNYIFSVFIVSIAVFLPTFFYFRNIQGNLFMAERVLKMEFYFSLIMVALLVAALSVATRSPFGFSKKLEGLLGDWSYPMYLYHMIVGMAVSYVIWGEPLRGLNYPGIVSFLISMPLLIALCHANGLMEEPLQRIRKRFRGVDKSPVASAQK